MKEEWNWKPANYVFHVQNADDFYRQLQQFVDTHLREEDEVEDLSLANEMLQSIGVKCK